MTWQVSLVPRGELRAVWPKVAPLLLRAIPYTSGRTDLRSIFGALQDERQWLWIAFDDGDKAVVAAFVTHLAKYSKGSALVIDCAGGGQMTHWLAIASRVFRRCAADLGAERVELYGRKGWARVLKSCGWQQKMVVLEIDPLVEGT
jgi:hypothetical protein